MHPSKSFSFKIVIISQINQLFHNVLGFLSFRCYFKSKSPAALHNYLFHLLTFFLEGTESPMNDPTGRARRVSGSSSRNSPGPGSIYRTMPLPTSSGCPTPSHLVRPIPQHVVSSGPSPFSPITVPKMNQSPVSL